MKRRIPNTITLLNLLAGCISIVFSARGSFEIAGYCIFIAAIFDFFDGFAARLLKAYSPLGIQLDSLADMVSFGIAPAMMLFYTNYFNFIPINTPTWILAGIPFLIPLFSALRLAKFNIDSRQTESFIGLPTPACALLVASALIYGQNHFTVFITNEFTIVVASIILSILLVSEIPMFSLKIKKPADGSSFVIKYTVQIVFLAVTLILIILFRFGGLAMAILLYIVTSLINWLILPDKIKTMN